MNSDALSALIILCLRKLIPHMCTYMHLRNTIKAGPFRCSPSLLYVISSGTHCCRVWTPIPCIFNMNSRVVLVLALMAIFAFTGNIGRLLYFSYFPVKMNLVQVAGHRGICVIDLSVYFDITGVWFIRLLSCAPGYIFTYHTRACEQSLKQL